jgi:hypothetical protein
MSRAHKVYPPLGGEDISAHKSHSRTLLCVRGNVVISGGGVGNSSVLARYTVDSRSALTQTAHLPVPENMDTSISALCVSNDGQEVYCADSATKNVALVTLSSGLLTMTSHSVIKSEDDLAPMTFALAISKDDQFL